MRPCTNWIRSIALDTAGVKSFKKAPKSYQNLDTIAGKKADTPRVWISDIKTKTITNGAGLRKNTYTFIGGITTTTNETYKADLDSPIEDLETTIAAMAVLGEKFHKNLLDSEVALEYFDFNYEECLHIYDRNEVGIVFMFTTKLDETLASQCP